MIIQRRVLTLTFNAYGKSHLRLACSPARSRCPIPLLIFCLLGLFTSHEVDMATFPSLTEKDLCEIGITAWGARRKIMLLIAGT